MATSVVGICNMALYRLGSTATIAAIDEDSAEARACNLFYEQCRDQVLTDFPWSFAQRHVLLSQLASTSAETAADAFPRNWGFKYSYPSDCLHVQELVSPVNPRNPRNAQRVPYEVLSDGAAKAIYTDQEDAELIYSTRVTDVTKWEPIAVSALAYLLGAEISPGLSKLKDIATRLMSGYYQAGNAGAARSMNEGFQVEPMGEIEGSRA